MTQTTFSYPQPAAPAWAPVPGHPDAPIAGHRLGFFLLLLVNAALFMRPVEIFPDLFYSQTYLVLIVACFLVSVSCVVSQLTRSALAAQPITVCVLGLVLAIALSHLTRLTLEPALDSSWEFAKVDIYYLLCVGLLNSSGRLRQFLFWLVPFIFVQTLVGMLQYYGVVQNEYFETIKEEKFETAIPVIRGVEYVMRLCGSGIFHNPNELCYPMGMAMMVCLFFVCGRYFLPLRVLCLAAMIFFGYAFTLTHSRGGFIGLIFGLLSFLLARFGWRKALPFTAILLPALFILFAGRQTDIDTTQGTGQDRIQLWNEALIAFIRNPLFGLGTGLFQKSAGLVAHNSYLQAYSELGFFGGTLFVGAFYLAVVSLIRLGSCQERIIDPELRRLRPYLVGLVGGFMGCMATMSLTDMLPTYMVLAVVVAYLRVATIRPPLPQLPRFQPGLVLRLAGVSALTLVVFRLYVWFTFIAG